VNIGRYAELLDVVNKTKQETNVIIPSVSDKVTMKDV
jgi:hypothetical protein